MTAAHPHHIKNWGVAGLRQLKGAFDHIDNAGQIGAWIDKPHLSLHGKGVGALLHNTRALAVVFANDNQRAADDARGGNIR